MIAPGLSLLPDTPFAHADYRWLIKALVTHAMVMLVGCCFIAIMLLQSAGDTCTRCHISAGALADWGVLLAGYAVALVEAVLNIVVYFVYRVIDRSPHHLRPLAIVLLVAYLLWPLLAIISWLDAP